MPMMCSPLWKSIGLVLQFDFGNENVSTIGTFANPLSEKSPVHCRRSDLSNTTTKRVGEGVKKGGIRQF